MEYGGGCATWSGILRQSKWRRCNHQPQPERDTIMKRLITALALSTVALSASAFEVGAPYEQLNVDRALPNIEFAPVATYVADSRAPFEQLVIDRALPNLPSRNAQFAAAAGGTR